MCVRVLCPCVLQRMPFFHALFVSFSATEDFEGSSGTDLHKSSHLRMKRRKRMKRMPWVALRMPSVAKQTSRRNNPGPWEDRRNTASLVPHTCTRNTALDAQVGNRK